MGRINNIMNEEMSAHYTSPAELIRAKFIELKDSSIGKYFFLYFLHLMGYLEYKEDKTESVFSDKITSFRVPLPLIDSEEKYREIERINLNLEQFFEFLKKQEPPEENLVFSLLEDI